MTFRYAHSANYSFYHQMSSKLTKHNRIKKIGHQIHRKHYIRPNNLSLDLADWWNRNNHKKDTSSRGVTTFFAKSVGDLKMTPLAIIMIPHEAQGWEPPSGDINFQMHRRNWEAMTWRQHMGIKMAVISHTIFLMQFHGSNTWWLIQGSVVAVTILFPSECSNEGQNTSVTL